MVKHELALREKSIVFVGFMGVGKTTIGKKVAKKLYRDFFDIDEEIEKEFGMATTEIFEQFGEKTFREREKSIIIRLSEQPSERHFCWRGSIYTGRNKKCLLSQLSCVLSRFIMGKLEGASRSNY